MDNAQTNGEDLQVIVSHPARQGFVYQVPLAIERAGVSVTFLTGLYYKPEQLPYSLVTFLPPSKRAKVVRQLEKRRLNGINPESVVSLGGPWLEGVFRPSSSFDVWYKTHDLLASNWLNGTVLPPRRTILHCFDGSSKRTIRIAKQKGITTALEVTLPIIAADLVKREMERLGLPINGRRLLNSAAWVNRLDEECRMTDYVIAQSRLTVDYLFSLGIPPRRIVLAPLGVDIERFTPALNTQANRPFRVLFVGQIGIRKGVQYLLQVWKELDLPNAELLLAGGINSSEFGNELLRECTGNCRHLGFVDGTSLTAAYQDSDVFVLPSLAEGAAMVMHEAMASGLPCIVSENVGCTLRDGVEGFVIPNGDVESLRVRLLQLFWSPELRKKMGAAARARAEMLSWSEYGRRLLLTYHRILSGERNTGDQILDMTEA